MTVEWVIENWLVIVTTAITAASVIAKATPNTTDNQVIAIIQKIVDAIAMSSAPTKHTKIEDSNA